MLKRNVFVGRFNPTMRNSRKKISESYDKKVEIAAKQIVEDLTQASYYDVLDEKVDKDGSFEGSFILNKTTMNMLDESLKDFEDGEIAISNFNLNRSEQVRDFYMDAETIEFTVINSYYEISYRGKWAFSQTLEYTGTVDDDYMHPEHTVGGLTGLK